MFGFFALCSCACTTTADVVTKLFPIQKGFNYHVQSIPDPLSGRITWPQDNSVAAKTKVDSSWKVTRIQCTTDFPSASNSKNSMVCYKRSE